MSNFRIISTVETQKNFFHSSDRDEALVAAAPGSQGIEWDTGIMYYKVQDRNPGPSIRTEAGLVQDQAIYSWVQDPMQLALQTVANLIQAQMQPGAISSQLILDGVSR